MNTLAMQLVIQPFSLDLGPIPKANDAGTMPATLPPLTTVDIAVRQASLTRSVQLPSHKCPFECCTLAVQPLTLALALASNPLAFIPLHERT